MYGYNDTAVLSKDEVLKRVSQEDIFRVVMECSLNEYHRSPFREDDVAGAFFDWHQGKLHFIDFGDTKRTHRDCFNAVQDVYGVGFKEALELIDEHFNLGLGEGNPVDVVYQDPRPKQVLKKRTDIIWEKRPLGILDARYWKEYGISSTNLRDDKVFGVRWYKFFSRKFRGEVIKRPATVSYAYTDFPDNRVKIYVPHATRRGEKWISNCSKDDIGNLDDLPIRGKHLTITKSYKDCRILRNCGVTTIWLQNEGVIPDEQIISRLGRRFDIIHILYDNDEPGMLASTRIRQIINSIHPMKAVSASFAIGAKDTGQFYKKFGKGELMKFIVQRNLI